LASCEEKKSNAPVLMPSDLNPPSSITKELFAEWRSPRRGTSQAERMDNPVWQWMLEGDIGTYLVTEHFKLGSAMDLGPGWCSQRYGQSETTLPDGRVLLIAGEHEDHYDPDFFIYNDVIVKNPDGSVYFYSYPEADFPPTDFHSATLLEEEILLIGNLGYPEDRRPEETLVQKLSLKDFHIKEIKTSGECPGWISDHQASLVPAKGKVVITGGQVFGEDGSLLENIDDWSLDLATWKWTRLTKRKWTRVEFAKEDGGWLNLFEMRGAQQMKDAGEDLQKMAEETRALFVEGGVEDDELLDELSGMGESSSQFSLPDDPALFASLYRPPLEFEELPEGDEYDVFRIKVGDVRIRYQEKGNYLMMTIEGELSEKEVKILTEDLKEKLAEIFKTKINTRTYK